MWDQQSLKISLRQSLCLSLEYSMSVKLLTEHHLEFLSLTGAALAGPSLHLSKCHIVGNHVSRLIWIEFLSLFSREPPSPFSILTTIVIFPLFLRMEVLKLFSYNYFIEYVFFDRS